GLSLGDLLAGRLPDISPDERENLAAWIIEQNSVRNPRAYLPTLPEDHLRGPLADLGKQVGDGPGANTFNLSLHRCKIVVWRELGSRCCVRPAGWRTGSRWGGWPGRSPARRLRRPSTRPGPASCGPGCSRRG